MFKVPAWVAIALTVVAGSAAAAGMSMTPSRGGQFAYGHPGPGGGPEHVIHVRVFDTLRFDPARIVVSRGETVDFVVTNAGQLLHEFVIGDAAVQAAHQREMQAMPDMSMGHDANAVTLPPGQTRNLVWTFTRDGTVEYACHVSDHFAAGMVGKIVIRSSARR